MLNEAIELTRQWPNPNHLVYSYVLQVLVLIARGDLHKARVAITEADKIRMNVHLTRGVRRIVEAFIVRAWILLQRSGIKLVPGDFLVEHSKEIVASWQNELVNSEKKQRYHDGCMYGNRNPFIGSGSDSKRSKWRSVNLTSTDC